MQKKRNLVLRRVSQQVMDRSGQGRAGQGRRVGGQEGSRQVKKSTIESCRGVSRVVVYTQVPFYFIVQREGEGIYP